MRLHSVVAPAVAAVNPWRWVTVTPSRGYATNPDGTRVPTYGSPYPARAQVQALTFTDIQQLNGLNVQGERRAIYLREDVRSVLRPDQRGGDLIAFSGDRTVWLVAIVLENWHATSGWVKVAVTRQNPNLS